MTVSCPGPVRSQTGFTMVEVLFTTAILSAAIYFVSGTMSELLTTVRMTDQSTSILSLRGILTSTVQDPAAWEKTISMTNQADKKSIFACWNDTKHGCSISTGGNFSMYGADGKLYLDSYDPIKNPSQGFTVAGDLCNTFSTKKPDPKCPVRVVYSAAPICQPGSTCFKPEFNVTIDFQFSFPEGSQPAWADSEKFKRTIRTASAATAVALLPNGSGGSGAYCSGGLTFAGVNSFGNVICAPFKIACIISTNISGPLTQCSSSMM